MRGLRFWKRGEGKRRRKGMPVRAAPEEKLLSRGKQPCCGPFGEGRPIQTGVFVPRPAFQKKWEE